MSLKKTFIFLILLFLYPQNLTSEQLNLQECIKIAFKNNHKIKQIEKQIKSQKLNVKLSSSPLYPRIDNSSSYSKSKSRIITENYSTSFSLNQLIYDSGKISSNIQRTKTQLSIAESEYNQTKINLIYQVKIKYYDLLYKQKVLEVAKEFLEKTKLHLNLAKVRFDSGLSAKSDVLKAELEVKRSELDLISAENKLKKANIDLNRTLGVDLQKEFFVDEELKIISVENDLDFYINCALKKRQEILQQDLRIQDLKFAIKGISADKKPYLSLRGSYSYSDIEFPPKEKTWDVGTSLNINLYDGSKIKNETKSYRENIEKLKIEKSDIQEEIKQEVISAYLNLKNELDAISVADKTILYAEENLKLAEGRYSAGIGTIIELTDAQIQLKQAKLDKINYIILYLKTQTDLNKSIGEENF